MTTTIVHISDLHLRSAWPEEQGVVLREFFEDLKKKVSQPNRAYVLCTGDVLQAGENFLQKPFGPDQLLETVRRCLDT